MGNPHLLCTECSLSIDMGDGIEKVREELQQDCKKHCEQSDSIPEFHLLKGNGDTKSDVVEFNNDCVPEINIDSSELLSELI